MTAYLRTRLPRCRTPTVCLFGECRHFGFVLLLSLGELLFRFELFGLRSVGHLRAFIVVINAVFQLFDVIALFLKSFEYCGRRFRRP